jgi:hypothetical protein
MIRDAIIKHASEPTLDAYLHSTARGRLDPRAVMTVVGTEVQGLLQGVGHQRDCVEISRIVLAGIFFVVNGVINTTVVANQPCVTVRHNGYSRCDLALDKAPCSVVVTLAMDQISP